MCYKNHLSLLEPVTEGLPEMRILVNLAAKINVYPRLASYTGTEIR